jgi:hypothetical protein
MHPMGQYMDFWHVGQKADIHMRSPMATSVQLRSAQASVHC